MTSERCKRREARRGEIRRRKRAEAARQEALAWKAKRRPQGHFCLWIPADVRLTGISDWRPDVTADSVDWMDAK